MISESAIRSIRDFDSFINFLRRELGWHIPEGHLEVEDITYDFLADELNLDDTTRRRLQNDCIRQLMPFTEGQPWGIFLVELHEPKVYTTFLRRLLRGLVPNRRAASNLRGWPAENLLFICTPDYRSFTFAHFTGDKPHNAKLTTFGWTPDEPIRTLCEYNLPALQYCSNDFSRWQTAFDVEKVTQTFFSEYKTIFDWTKKQLRGIPDESTSHIFTQKLFNRLLFLCFLQKKRWLDYNPRYLFDLFERAKAEGKNFYADYLYYLFFWGLNQPYETQLPSELQARLGRVPFLNGGLFEMDEWDAQGKVQIDNPVFERIFDELLGKYNFTVTESTPLDIEVAIDPEMLGKVYEALISERNRIGSFYTPRIEVRLMCREALKAYLHSPPDFRSLRDFGSLQAFIDEERADALTEDEAYDIYRALLNIKICDPAIGSGAFLVAMMNELVAIFRRLASRLSEGQFRYIFENKLADPRSVYDLKLHILQNCLYGADIDDFAVEIAKLRFWLSLAVDTEIEFENREDFEARIAQIPALPNLLYKIRVGDSILAKIGDVNFDVYWWQKRELPLSGEEARMIREKKAGYFTRTDEEKKQIQAEIEKLEGDFEKTVLSWTGQRPQTSPQSQYILWQVHFAEIFEGEDFGFDIVIANPPYIRQELLSKEYKADLEKTYQSIFGADLKINKKSDLYVYFYLRGISLLKPGGVMCFICSNSWLDVGYGASLQGFLLKHTRILRIIDNSAKRSFSSADVNTTINLFQRASPPNPLSTCGEGEKAVKFVAFRQPFEQATTAENLKAIATATEITSTPAYRVFPISQKQLWEEGAEKDERTGKIKYVGDKWGGKYLRAPDIFFTILEKGKGKLVRLGDIAEVRFGIKTGANEFFYLDEEKIEKWGIEEEFLKPVIKSPRECKSILVKPEDLKFKFFMCHKDKRELKGTSALRYIEWGEKQGFHRRPSCRGRRRWWDIGKRLSPPMMVVKGPWNRHFIPVNVTEAFCDQQIYEVEPYYPKRTACLQQVINSTLTGLFFELEGRSNFGEGILWIAVYEAQNVLVLNPETISPAKIKELTSIFTDLAIREVKPIFDEIHQPDRRALDDIVFDALGLTAGEREAVYEAVVELVKRRLEKAKSV